MKKVYKGFGELVGNTPLVQLSNIEKALNNNINLFAKIEMFNPGGSVKDRIAKEMIDNALLNNVINLKTTLIEPTSGNTGIGIASYAASLGIKVILTMPESMSIERRKLLQHVGAELVLTPASGGMKGAIEKAQELNETIENSHILGQFNNPNNPEAHYKTTGPEIFESLDGKVDILIAGIGTGGTISGTGRYLKEKDPDITIIGIEPTGSPVLSQQKSGPHGIQGIGAGFVPDTLNTEIYDEIITITNEEALEASKLVARTEGLIVGISSGATIMAAKIIASQKQYQNKNVVVILPDTGERYLSTALFD